MLDFPDNLFCAVGQIIVYWSMVENSMHNCIFCIYHDADGKSKIPNKRVPIKLSNKIAYWKMAFELPSLRLFRIDALALLDRIENLQDEKHNLTHGVFAGKYGDILKIIKHWDKKSLENNEYKLIETSINHLFEAGKKIQGLAKDLQDFSHQIQGQFGS